MNKGLFYRLLSPWLYSLALLLLAPALLAAERPHVYSGTLGKMPIVVELDLSDPGEISGRYFYRKYHHDIPLSGQVVGDTVLNLQEGAEDYQHTSRPQFHLDKRDKSALKGQWEGPGGKVFKVILAETPIESPPAGSDPFWYEIYERSPYDFERLKGLSLRQEKQQDFMGYKLQWWLEPVSKIRMFEVVSGYPEVQLSLINRQLRARLWSEVIGYHSCMLGGSAMGADYLQTVTPRLLSKNIVSLSIFTSYSCGGAHPDFGDSPLNLNARTGEQLGLEDVLWLGDGPAFHYRDAGQDEGVESAVDFNIVADYRREKFVPWLIAELQEVAPEEMRKPAAQEDECDYSDPEVWNFPAWYFTAEGIYFYPYFPRVMRPCDGPEWPIVPYSSIQEHPGRVDLSLPD